jgi:ribosomal protein S11
MAFQNEVLENRKRPPAASSGPALLAVAPGKVSKGGKRRKTEAAIAALMCGQTIEQAAHDCGIGYRTLKTWLASDWFQTEYHAAKKELLDSTINQLRAVGGDGVAALHDVVVNVENPPAARVSAARAILEVLLKAVEIQDITTRLERLEAAMKVDER